MPNILAHTHVTAKVLGTKYPDVLLGSTLPDFAAMYLDHYADPIPIKGASPEFEMGISFHQKTDVVFNRQPERPEVTAPLAAHLTAEGIHPYAARLAANFVSKLLLDKALLDSAEARQTFAALGEHVRAKDLAVLERNFVSKRFGEYIKGYFIHDVPSRYADPEELAEITFRRLTFRSYHRYSGDRTTFDVDQVPMVAEIVDTHTERATRLGMKALAATINILSYQNPPLD